MAAALQAPAPARKGESYKCALGCQRDHISRVVNIIMFVQTAKWGKHACGAVAFPLEPLQVVSSCKMGQACMRGSGLSSGAIASVVKLLWS